MNFCFFKNSITNPKDTICKPINNVKSTTLLEIIFSSNRLIHKIRSFKNSNPPASMIAIPGKIKIVFVLLYIANATIEVITLRGYLMPMNDLPASLFLILTSISSILRFLSFASKSICCAAL